MLRTSARWIAGLAFGLAATLAGAQAPATIKIGAIYPLSGPLASTGRELQQAVELAALYINEDRAELGALPLAKGVGLPKLKGAKIEIVFADSQGKPEVGQSEAERLIAQDKVVALIGAYQSAVTRTASRVAEQRGIPFVNGESSSPDLTERGYKWFFRTTPNDETFIANMMSFLDGVNASPTAKIAVIYENTDFGVNTFKAIQKLIGPKRTIVADIAYAAGTASLNSEVQRLAAAKPDVAIFASYTSDAMLFVRTMRESKYAPPILLANDAGFIDSKFVGEIGPQAQGVLTRDVWANDLSRLKPIIKTVNEEFKKRYGKDLNGNSARALQGLLVLAEAIDRAGSTEPEALRKALVATKLAENQVVMPWGGVQFDAKGQNVLGAGLIVQLVGTEYRTVWPANFKESRELPALPFAWK